MSFVKKISTNRQQALEAQRPYAFREPERPIMPLEGSYDLICRIVDNRLRAIRFWHARKLRIDHADMQFLIEDMRAQVAKQRSRPDAQLKSALKDWFRDLSSMIECVDPSLPDTVRAVYVHLAHDQHRDPETLSRGAKKQLN